MISGWEPGSATNVITTLLDARARGAPDSEATAFVEKAFSDFLETVFYLAAGGVYDLTPLRHTVGDELRKVIFLDSQPLGKHCGLVGSDCHPGRTVKFRTLVIEVVDRDYKVVHAVETCVDFRDDRTIFIRYHDLDTLTERVRFDFSHIFSFC